MIVVVSSCFGGGQAADRMELLGKDTETWLRDGKFSFLAPIIPSAAKWRKLTCSNFTAIIFSIESAGLEYADAVDPLVVKVMAEDGIDLSGKQPRNLFELFRNGTHYDHVITVCDESEADSPVFPALTKTWRRPFPNPDSVYGTEEEKLQAFRDVRDQIKNWLYNPPAGLRSIDFSSMVEH